MTHSQVVNQYLGADLVNPDDGRVWHCHAVLGSDSLRMDGRGTIAGKERIIPVDEIPDWLAAGWVLKRETERIYES